MIDHRPIILVFILLLSPRTFAYEPDSHYTRMNVEGWRVTVHNALLPGGEHQDTGTAALKQLRYDLIKVRQCVPDEPLAKLLDVGVWLELDSTNGPHGRTPVFHYHPGLDWLVKMDFHPGKHKCVEFSKASALVQLHRRKPSARTLLHELAHAYHDQVLGFDDPNILAAYTYAVEGTTYPANDWVKSNHKEFFAGVTTRYFGTEEDRAALIERDPNLNRQLQKIWGEPRAYTIERLGHEPTAGYTRMDIEGWKVTVHNALLPGGELAETGAAAIEVLRRDMARLKQCIAAKPLEELLKIEVWLERDSTNGPYGRTPVFHYHPDMDWLAEMDFHPGKHKCVEYSRAEALANAGKNPERSLGILLHELAHAYHDQVPTFDDPDILAAYKRAVEGDAYPAKDWVKSDHKEFFAGVTTRYFGTKTERDALKERDPVLFKRLRRIWRKPKAFIKTD